jgi:glycogen debranching enzyme
VLLEDEVVYQLDLAPRRPLELCLEVSPIFKGERVDPSYGCRAFASHDTAGDRVRDRWLRGATRLITPNHRVAAAWDRAIADLGALALQDGEGARALTPAAGIPIYQALFGRDTLTAAWQAAAANPLMLRGTLETIAAWLGKRYDDRYDEQPGRVIHQHQLSPLSLLGRNPFLHYYGDYAGPGMFLVGLAWYFWQTGDRDFVRSLRGPALRCLAWMDRDGDRDGDGFYEYATKAGKQGTKNQGWKDSNEAVLTAEGQNVEDPIAVVEIQGYYYAAKQQMGLVFMALGEVALGARLLAEAADLKHRFNRAFWMPEEQYYALALGPDKAQVRSISSNAGQALACGIVDNDKARAVADRLMAPDMFSGWGIRTLSSEHPAYNPFTYHLGSVWPSENASIALGLRRYGFSEHTQRLAEGLFAATGLFDADRLPEVIAGNPRDGLHPHPGIYPNSNAPQAWSASAIVMLVQALLGMVPVAPLRLLLIDPILPEWLPELTLEHVPVGDARVSLHFRRCADGRTDYRVTQKQGRVRVLRQAPPNSLEVGLGQRAADLAGSLVHRQRWRE